MAKRDLKLYLKPLTKKQLEEQIIDLYDRFKEVKQFYDFAFNPNEKKLLEESKLKIANEYFPITRRKPKMRRSVAQKFIKHYLRLGVDPYLIADLMCYNIEIAQTFCSDFRIAQDAFYTSMLKSYNETCQYIVTNGLLNQFNERLKKISTETQIQRWINYQGFEKVLDDIF